MAVNVGAIEGTITLRDKMTASLERVTGKLGKMQGSLGKLSSSATNTGRSLSMGLTVPLVALGGGALKAAIDFESSFAGVRKTVEATEPEFQKLAQSFRDMAKEIPINVNELNRIGEAAGQLGIKKENIVSFTRTMADLGVTTNMAAEEAATALARFANITGMAQEDFDRLGSTIVDLGNNFATTEGEIVEMALRLAGAGSQIGMTEAEIMGMAAALSSVGIRAEAGGTAMSRVMIDIASAVGKGGDAVRLFADTAEMSVGAFTDLFGRDSASALTKFVQGLGKVGDEGSEIFNVLEEMGFANIRTRDSLLRSAGASEMFAKAMTTATGAFRENNALAEEAEKRYKTVASQLAILWNNVKDLGIELGQQLIPHLMDLVDHAKNLVPKIEKMVQGFRDMSPAAKSFAFHFVAIAAVAGPGLIFLGSVGNLATGILATAAAVKGLAVSIGMAKAAAMGWIGLGLAATGAVVWFQMSQMNKEFEALEGNLTKGTRIWREYNGQIKVGGTFLQQVAAGTIILTKEEEALMDELKKVSGALNEVSGVTVKVKEATEDVAEVINRQAVPAVRHLTDAQQTLKDDLTGAILPARDWMAVLKDIGGASALTEKQTSGMTRVLGTAMRQMKAAGQAPDQDMFQWWVQGMDRAKNVTQRSVADMLTAFNKLHSHKMFGGVEAFAPSMGIGGIGLPTLPPEPAITAGSAWATSFTKGWRSIIKNIPDTVSRAFTGGGGALGAVKAIGSQFGSQMLGGLFGSFGGKAKEGEEAAGGIIGMFSGLAGPIGMAIGSLAGPIIGGLTKLFSGPTVAESVRKTSKKMFRTGISVGLSEAIQETRESVGSDFAAMMMHMSSIIEEQGGVMTMGIEFAIRRVRDIFSAVEQGTLSTAQAAKTFGESFTMIADALVESGGIASAKFVELITLAERFGTTAETLKFVGEQSKIASEGLAALFGPTIAEADKLTEAIEKQREAIKGMNGDTKEGAIQIQNATENLNGLLKEQSEFGKKSKGELADLGLVAVASFESALAAGMSFTDAVKAHGPAIDAVIKAQESLGITTDNVALKQLSQFAKRVEQNKGLVAGVEALDSTMLALSRTGSLNAESLGAMERQGMRMFEKLIGAGFSQNEAIMMMGPSLKTMMEAHEKLGIPIDENTEKLLAQAKEAGAMEKDQLTGWGKVEAAVMMVVESLDKFINRIAGVDKGLRNIPTKIQVQLDIEENYRRGQGGSGTGIPGHSDGMPFAHGGIVTSPTHALIGEAGPEAVIPLDQFNDRNLLEELKGMRTDLRNMPLMLRDALILAQ